MDKDCGQIFEKSSDVKEVPRLQYNPVDTISERNNVNYFDIILGSALWSCVYQYILQS